MAVQPVELRVAADPALAAVVRMTTVVLASGVGFDVDEIDDLKLAVDELLTIAISRLRLEDVIELRFQCAPGHIEIDARTDATEIGPTKDPDPVASAILAVTVDWIDLEPAPPLLFRLRKRSDEAVGRAAG